MKERVSKTQETNYLLLLLLGNRAEHLLDGAKPLPLLAHGPKILGQEKRSPFRSAAQTALPDLSHGDAATRTQKRGNFTAEVTAKWIFLRKQEEGEQSK